MEKQKCEACGIRQAKPHYWRKNFERSGWLGVCKICYGMDYKDYRKMLIEQNKKKKVEKNATS